MEEKTKTRNPRTMHLAANDQGTKNVFIAWRASKPGGLMNPDPNTKKIIVRPMKITFANILIQ